MLKKLLLSFLVLTLMAPVALADTEMVELEASEEDSMLYPDYYGTESVYFNVSTTTSVEADKVYVYGTYTVDNARSRKDAVSELRTAYRTIQEVLANYGTVSRTSLYTYEDWEGTGMYDASLSIRLDLSDYTELTTVEDLLYDEGFDNWFEALVLDTTHAESKVTKTLNRLIEAKKEVYEEVLGYALGKVDGLTIYSWPDSTSFDESTGMVDVTVNASVWYYND